MLMGPTLRLQHDCLECHRSPQCPTFQAVKAWPERRFWWGEMTTIITLLNTLRLDGCRGSEPLPLGLSGIVFMLNESDDSGIDPAWRLCLGWLLRARNWNATERLFPKILMQGGAKVCCEQFSQWASSEDSRHEVEWPSSGSVRVPELTLETLLAERSRFHPAHLDCRLQAHMRGELFPNTVKFGRARTSPVFSKYPTSTTRLTTNICC
jgi:hypothetical protein